MTIKICVMIETSIRKKGYAIIENVIDFHDNQIEGHPVEPGYTE